MIDSSFLSRCWSVLCLVIALLLAGPQNRVAGQSFVESWRKTYNGSGNWNDQSRAVTIDAQGNVYVAATADNGTDKDFVTIKYDPAGNQAWAVSYDGPVHGDDEPVAIAVDEAGNVIVTGGSQGSSASALLSDFVTVKYDPNGVQLWVSRYDGPLGATDTPVAIALDTGGNIFVTGISVGQASPSAERSSDYLTVKYDSSGTQKWVDRYDGSANGSDQPCAIAVDSSGNVTVTGTSAETTLSITTIKYSATGNRLWRVSATSRDYGVAHALALDQAGNVYVTGEGVSSRAYPEYFTLKYNMAGEEEWRATFHSPILDKGETPAGIAVDSEGNVYVTGEVAQAGGASDIGTIKYSPAGVQLWVSLYTSPGPNITYDRGYRVGIDQDGSVFVLGNGDFRTVSLKLRATDGQLLGHGSYSGISANVGTPRSVVAPDGNIFIVGSVSTGIGTDAALVKLIPNRAPSAQGDDVHPPNGGTFIIPVLANDTDPDAGQTLQVLSVSQGMKGAVSIYDEEFDRSAVIYTPGDDFDGSDTFTYTVTDQSGGAATATVTVRNAAPVPTADIGFAPKLGTVTVDCLKNDTDPDGDSVTLVDFTQPAFGSVERKSGKLVYTVGKGFKGADTFTYTIRDSFGVRSVGTVVVRSYLGLKSSFSGYLGELSNPAGFLQVATTTTGAFSGTVRIGKDSYRIKGVLDSEGRATVSVKRKGPLQPLSINLHLDVTGDVDSLSCTISGTGADYAVSATRFAIVPEIASAVGAYTMAIQAPQDASIPQGSGWASVTVSSKGSVKVKGRLADGRALSVGTQLWSDGRVPVFTGFDFATSGHLRGVVSFPRVSESQECAGVGFWAKPKQKKAPYLEGFSTPVQIYGSRYKVPVIGMRSLDYGDLTNAKALVEFRDPDLSVPLPDGKLVSVSSSDGVKPVTLGTDKITMKIDRGSGLFSGNFIHPQRGRRTFSGVLLQNDNKGAGFYLGSEGSGLISVSPQ